MEDKNQTVKRKWKCLVCGATGKHFLTSWKANRSGRQHINIRHNRKGNLIILKEKIIVKS